MPHTRSEQRIFQKVTSVSTFQVLGIWCYYHNGKKVNTKRKQTKNGSMKNEKKWIKKKMKDIFYQKSALKY